MTGDRTDLVREALDQIRDLRRRLADETRLKHEPIAIVGMACRFPGEADDLEGYWRVLDEGRSVISEVPADRFDIDALYDPDPDAPGRTSVRHGGFIRDVAGFDPHFFGISPAEAASLDPQQRLLLEGCWHALEDGGVAPDSLHGSPTGVFVGIGSSDYAILRSREEQLEDVDAYLALGTCHSVASGRVSYVLGLRGPSYAIDTACSSSLVAIHLAVRSLRAGECSLALAGGVAALLAPDYFVNFSHARMLALDGRCKTFDAAADGYVRSEGCGMLVLKRLSDALSAGDRIRAVIRGTATNQDGRSSGLTAPNGPSQEEVIRTALADGRVDPHDVDYVEAHGTGTALGDPIEVQALGAALCVGRPADRLLRIGSAKTNMGHLEAAAGVAGLIKTVIALERERIPAHLHFETPNPHIDWARWPIQVVAHGSAWPRDSRPRLAGISAFGFSGTNCHLVIEEAPAVAPSEPALRATEIVTLSGRSEASLHAQASARARWLAAKPQARLADVAFTANVGRTHHAHRVAAVVDTVEGLRQVLEDVAAGNPEGLFYSGRTSGVDAPEVAFLFSGHGSVYPGMGKGLYRWGRVFRTELDRCARLLEPVLEKPLLGVLHGGESDLLDQSLYAQPALFALEYSLAKQWEAFGVRPAAALGHSAGEFVAACLAGAIRLEDAMRLIAARGRLVHELPGEGGAMYALLADQATVEGAIAGTGVAIAAFNGPGNLVISGPNGAIDGVVARLSERGVKVRRLAIPQAFHSAQLHPMLDAFEEVARSCAGSREPEIDFISNVTGERIGTNQRLDAGYWRHHARQPVQFEAGLNTLLASGYRVFLEIGPANVLSGLGAGFPGAEERSWIPSLSPEQSDDRSVLLAAAQLYVAGVALDWREIAGGQNPRAVSLPPTRFERERYWFREGPASSPSAARRVSTWERCASAAARQADHGPFDLAPSTFTTKWSALGRLTLAYQIDALRRLAAFAAAGEVQTPRSLCETYGVASSHTRLMARWLEHLAEAGFLVHDGPGFRALSPLPDPGLAALESRAMEAAGDYPELLAYVESCGPRLADVLRGKVSPLDTLFPDGSFEIADGLYHRSAVARYLNAMVRAGVEAAAASLPRGRRLRILEIGAGTGGTTAAVLPALDPEGTEYTFTDVSDFFFERARRRLGGYRFLKVARLDIDNDPAAQGFSKAAYDVVIAANVLHATRDLGVTLERVGWLLDQGGVLILNETTAHPRVFDITTGLIEGWQVFEDPLRQDNPLLSAPAWLDLLRAHGFPEAGAFPGSASVAAALGNHVIVAGRPGEALVGGTASVGAAADERSRAVEIARDREVDLVAQLDVAVPEERSHLLTDFVRRRVMRLLRLDEAHRPHPDARLTDLGLDSLMAVKLRNEIASGLRLAQKPPATLMFDYPSITAIASYLATQMFGPGQAPERVAAVPTPDPAPGADAIETLSEAEVERLMLVKLKSIAKYPAHE